MAGLDRMVLKRNKWLNNNPMYDPNIKEKHRKRIKESWEDPESRRYHVETIRNALKDPIIKERHLNSLKEIHNNEEIKKKKLETQQSNEYREKMSVLMKAKHNDKDFREKYDRGTALKNERIKNGEIKYKRGAEHWSSGKKLSKDTIEKIRKGNTGTTFSKERIQKIREGNCKYLYEITLPNGEIVRVVSLSEFSIKNNLSKTQMYRLANRKITNYKNYKIVKVEINEINIS
jgi:hypothetical protein